MKGTFDDGEWVNRQWIWEHLKIHRNTLAGWIKHDTTFPEAVILHGVERFNKAEVLTWIEAHRKGR